MAHLRIGVAVLAFLLLGVAAAQEKKDDRKSDEKPPEKLKGYLPPHYKKLGLSAEQTQKVYRIRAETKGKLDELRRQMAKLKTDEVESLEKVLTPGQLKLLRQYQTGKKSD